MDKNNMKVVSGEEALKTIFETIGSAVEEKERKERFEEEHSEERIPSFEEFMKNILSKEISSAEDNEDDECDCEFCRAYYNEEEDEDNKDESEEMPDFFKALLIRSLIDKIENEIKEIEKEEEKNEKEVKGHAQGKIATKDNFVSRIEMPNNIKKNTYKSNKKRAYTFLEMIEEFSNGSKETFTNGEDLFVYDNETLLIKTEVGVFPAPITKEIVNGTYFKKQILISSPKALELCLEGNVVNFSVELFGRNYTGTLTYKNNIPSYKINETEDIIGNQEAIILGALMNGTWSL